jgi:SnoaL-like domain
LHFNQAYRPGKQSLASRNDEMPSPDTVDRFVATVIGGDHVGAIERLHLEDASMRENRTNPRVGRDLLVRHEQQVMDAFKTITTSLIGAPVVHGDQVAIQWRFELTLHEEPSTTRRSRSRFMTAASATSASA